MAKQNHSDHHLYIAFLITFLAGMAFMAIIFTVKGKAMHTKAYSEFMRVPKMEQNCFDASLNGDQVRRCLGIPGPSDAGYMQPYSNYQLE